MRSRWFVLFSYKLSITSVLFGYEISKTVGFVSLQDFNDGWFCFFVLLRDFKDSRFCFVMRFKRWSGLFGYKISITVGQYQLTQDLRVSWYCSFISFQRWLGLFGYEISMTVCFIQLQAFNNIGFIWLYDFKDSWFCFIMRSQWRLVFSVSRFCSVVRFQRWSGLFLCSFTRFY